MTEKSVYGGRLGISTIAAATSAKYKLHLIILFMSPNMKPMVILQMNNIITWEWLDTNVQFTLITVLRWHFV